MAAFANLMRAELVKRGIEVSQINPQVRLGNLKAPKPVKKWLGYIDKFVAFKIDLKRRVRLESDSETVFHITDHSNAMYGPWLGKLPYVTTCHDMLAVRGGLGDPLAFCSASQTGAILQRWILNSLKKTTFIGCDSIATKTDLCQLTQRISDPNLVVVSIASNAPFVPLNQDEISEHLPDSLKDQSQRNYLLMVGSALPRKNRETAFRTLSSLKNRWNGILVIAGDALSTTQRELAKELKIEERILQVISPTHAELNALYSGAVALLFPSYAEGFGWPITEANACDCPVLCSNRTSVPEVAGEAAMIYDADDSEGFARGVLRLIDEPDLREELITKGRENLSRFTTEKMLDGYLDLYRRAIADSR